MLQYPCAQEWDLEICLLLLLLAAFTAANALSLVYMAATAAGMALSANAQQACHAAHALHCVQPTGMLHPAGHQVLSDMLRSYIPAVQRVWKWAVVPLLGALLLFQYSVLLGLPPSLRSMLTHMLGHQQARGALGLPEEVEVSRGWDA